MAGQGNQDPQRVSKARNRILETARESFYREGIRAVGVDTIVERSGVAKSTLYRWFPTKDDLVEAFLRAQDAEFWEQWDKVASTVGDPLEELRAQLEWIARYIASPRFRGCPFLRAAAEFPDVDHQVRLVCREHKSELRFRLAQLTRTAGLRRSEAIADQLALLIDGAFANSQALGKGGPAQQLRQSAQSLIDIATE